MSHDIPTALYTDGSRDERNNQGHKTVGGIMIPMRKRYTGQS